MRIILLALFLVAALPLAHAHPFTEETSPDARNSGAVGLTQVWVKYSEEVELDFSSLKVYDDDTGNQIDNRDTAYYLDERSLVVSTPPLEDGIYTVASKALSKVDGHLVPDTFTFAVGSAVIDPARTEAGERELVYLPEAGARFPGLVGQTVILGAAIAAMLVWGTQNKRPILESMGPIRRIHHDKFMSVVGVALIAVFASNIMMLVVQTIRLESFSVEIFATTFGTVWIVRMAITGAMLALWFVVNQRQGLGRGGGAVLMALSLVLLWTSSQIGHGAASGEWAPLVLDYIHNLVAAAWIGGVAYLCLVLLPALSAADWWGRERMALLLIPRFSTVFVVGLGVVIITGPVLMWFLESDVGMIGESIYGRLIMAKIAVAAAMVGLGGYLQVTSMRSAQEGVDNRAVRVYGRMRKTLRVEMVLGMVLLGVVAVLINGTLPAGEMETEAAESAGLRLVEFTGNTKFEIDVEPYTTGLNGIYVRASNLDGSPVQDETGVRVKISNPERNISPVALDLESAGEVDGVQEYSGEAIFGFAGRWLVEVESQREEGANESVTLSLPVKPDIGTMVASITEYELPEPAGPLYPLYDGSGSIWISDSSAPKLWKFDLEFKEFESFRFDGTASIFLTMDGQGRVWFTDIPSEQIGYLEPETGAFTLIGIPELEPAESASVPFFIEADRHGDIWVAVGTKDTILRYDVDDGTFDRFSLAPWSFPFALAEGPDGSIWFTTTNSSRIGYIVPETGQIREFAPEDPLINPESLLFLDGSVWISEHTGASLARFDPVLETFERVPLDVPDGLPYGMSLDRYGNIWIAQHTVDVVVIYDPVAGAQKQVPVPTNVSFVQFATADGDGNIWLAEQRGNKLAVGSTTHISSLEVPARQAGGAALMYTELASPLMAAGILAASLFFVKSIRDRRMLEDLILSD